MSKPGCNHRAFALLVCGKTTGKTYAENGDYIDIFLRFLQASLDSVQGQRHASEQEKLDHDQASLPLEPSSWKFTLDPYDVFQHQEFPSEEKIDEYDAIIITGSPASAYENVDWVNNLTAFVKRIADSKPRIKLIGICFGHQIIARALGGACVPNGGRWEIGPTPITLTELGKQIFGVDSLNIQEMHRDHVPADRSPPSFHLLGSTPLSANQGMVRFLPTAPISDSIDGDPSSESTPPSALPPFASPPSENQAILPSSSSPLLPQIHILTTQGHPEFSEPIVSSITEQRCQSGIIDPATAADAERRRYWRNDGVGVIGRAVWGMLGVA